MMEHRRTTILARFALVLGVTLLYGCAKQAIPELPASVPPLWTRTSFAPGQPPKALDTAGNQVSCQDAAYNGPGTAHVSVCLFPPGSGAFEAVQRTRASANTVKFQEGDAFALISWDKATRDEITELVHAVQRALKRK